MYSLHMYLKYLTASWRGQLPAEENQDTHLHSKLPSSHTKLIFPLPITTITPSLPLPPHHPSPFIPRLLVWECDQWQHGNEAKTFTTLSSQARAHKNGRLLVPQVQAVYQYRWLHQNNLDPFQLQGEFQPHLSDL